MKNNFFKKLIILIVVFLGLGFIVGKLNLDGQAPQKITQNSILRLDMNGVILNGKKFLANVDGYAKNDHIKAVLIDINSPGGAVGPSQEMFQAIKNIKDGLKKPVVCVTTGIMASGAYYAGVACDKIVVAPGALIGSIGVIFEFANMEKLYDWAKISRYSITSGKYKDSGAEYRSMRDDEKALFQGLVDEVYAQFRDTVKTSRNLADDKLDQYADGRVFTGVTAVKEGFADQIGFYNDAVKLAAEMAKLGDNYTVFTPPKKKTSIFDIGAEREDSLNSLVEFADSLKAQKGLSLEDAFKFLLKTRYLNQPMYLMPGVWE
ncbi:signal peptide peptidase [Bdellovibrio bacteriovorus W]|nr:signal peptide peptidase [Bdellovibrio bacteriovorus W]